MKPFLGILLRALLLLIGFSSIGLALNLLSSKPLPWVYVPPTVVEVDGLKVPLIDEKAAFKYLEDPAAIFVDTRKPEHFTEGHVKGAVSLPARDVEERFPLVQPLLPEESLLVLYCYGPECEDAERVAEFIAPMGYRKMTIMSPGFPGWEKAGYPVEGGPGKRDSGSETREDGGKR
jgi:rhodanese-related sulfurtransferase